jgi:catechol 2,3-dioxygenase-like lactoylglutathione lyase family enzyme
MKLQLVKVPLMQEKLIHGIQQVGVGVEDAESAFAWYARHLGADVSAFDDDNEATYMAKYMGGQPHYKRAIMAINMQGGAGYEVWQYTRRQPVYPNQPVRIGDYGISIAMVKSRDIAQSFARLSAEGVKVLTDIRTAPDGKRCFFIADPYGSMLQIKEFDHWYATNRGDTGGIFGVVIGVSDIDESLRLYRDILGFEKVIYDRTDTSADWEGLPGGQGRTRRILLEQTRHSDGGLGIFFGPSQLELVQHLDMEPRKIFQDRYWGDIGFIHVCFDIRNMDALVAECAEKGFPFQVLSHASFDMGDANGHWGYLEDPDGTLIEFVETKRIPILKALNLSINLEGRDPHKPLPRWFFKALGLKRIKT